MKNEEPVVRGHVPRLSVIFFLTAFLLAGQALVDTPAAAQDEGEAQDEAVVQEADDLAVLVFSKTAGFRHRSIEDGAQALREIGEGSGFSVTHTEDSTVFASPDLAGYGAVVFLNTTGDVLNDEQQAAFEQYIQEGGGYVGIHAAADTEYDWAWYGELVGGYFASHPHVQPADIVVSDREFPATAHLPEVWTRTDEWYDYRANPRGNVHVLAVLVEASYEGGRMGDDHPIAWAHEYDGGRAIYTGGGHTSESYEEPLFREHLHQAILWAAGRVDGDVSLD
ncbi:MAG: ThuA domain-containing protein [Bacteroidetes bacterium SB0662_bin_6]|nr:ThuA domain-containing protein [Bacteroidetes bacterium SB0668_bin_1]MYE05433.1 ThuA domain-containing protein [Bacteroidetes bacterium SB0662_bin_6]